MNKNQRKVTIRLTIPRLQLPRLDSLRSRLANAIDFLGPARARLQRTFLWRNRHIRYSFLFMAALVLATQIIPLVSPLFVTHAYALGDAETLLSDKNDQYKKHITYDQKKQAYLFEYGAPTTPSLTHASIGTVAATIPKDPTKGVVVSDSMNKVDFTMKPKFKLMEGRQDGNRITYPLQDGTGWLVYTMQAVGVKEDVVLNFAKSDTMSLEYELGLGDSMEARIQPDGSVNVYGNKLFSGTISAGTEKDAELLAKARKNAPKDSLLFTIPRPVINEKQGESKNVTASYELNGTTLKVNVKGLKTGNYPLAIDPSIYVVTAYQFMYGNNETNINFDVDNKMIRKGRLTGARFDSWQNTANLPIGSWGSGSVASGGYIYQVGGASFSGQVFSTQGASTYTVPAGVTSMTVKMWGAGGGGGETGGGDGGGAGYVEGTISVSEGQTFDVYIGGGGGAGGNNAGGGGGALTRLTRNSDSALMLVAAGGGGGAAQVATNDGGAGGGSSGGNASGTIGGGGGTQSAGGAIGDSTCDGAIGASLAGGRGASALLGFCNLGGGGAAGTNTGAAGGAAGTGNLGLSTHYGGGGGGGGYFGGGGGGSSTSAAGGGGGGSSYINSTFVTASSTEAGSGTTPGNDDDPYQGTAGNGGAAGSAGSTGLMVISTNAAGNPATKSLNWAKFDTGNGTVVNADPGNGQCSGWCSTSTYDMPEVRSNFSLVAYNGYLYAMGGSDDSGPNPTSSGHKYTTAFIAKLGANGEPRLWHPDNSDPSTWEYWYESTGSSMLPDERINGGAVAYNNKMYFVGGLNDSQSGSNWPGTAQSTVWVANILPTGKLGAWSTTTALTSGGPGALFGMNTLVYNDRLYIVGGNTAIAGAPIDDVYYIKINSDGSLASSWVQTSSFTTGRLNMGGTNAAIWGGYLYVVGGCSTVNSNGICTTVVGDTQIASINADGSLGTFSTVSGLTESRMGFGMLAWRDNLYVVGGCTSQDPSSGSCLGGIQAGIDYGHINLSGDVSSIATSAASGTSPCSGGTPTNCNLPGTGNVGNLLTSAVIHNGYLYVVGGCTLVGCTSTSNGIAFTTISSNGDAIRPGTCPTGSTATNGWCAMDTNMPASVAAASATVFNDTLYIVGGFTGSALADSVKRAPLNSDGTVGTWSTQQMSGSTNLNATAVSYTYATVRANPSDTAYPGNLYTFGGCTTSGSGSACSAYTDSVYKCKIKADKSIGIGTTDGCTKTGQLQIGTPSEATGAGMATTSGTVYANYIYLIGGVAPGASEMTKVRYAKFDNSNNVVTVNSGWKESSFSMPVSRRSAAAFGYNGHLYVVGGHQTGTGVLSDILFVKINTTDGDLSAEGWKTSTTTITGRWGLSAAVGGSQVYTMGGCTVGTAPTCTAMTPTVQRFQIYNNSSGGPVSYGTDDQLATGTIGSSATVLNGYLYTAGGCTNLNCTGNTNKVYYTAIEASGSIGAWQDASTSGGTNLPTALGWGKLLTAGGTLYYVGGQTGQPSSTAVSTVYFTTGFSSGAPIWSGTPAQKGIGDTGSGGQQRTQFGAAVWNDRLYVAGGYYNNNTVQSTVYVSPQQSSGGDITGVWTSSTAFNVARAGLSVVAYANNLYILGGNDGTNYLSDTQYAKIDTTNGTVGSWSYGANLPSSVSEADAFAANGYIYLVGGRSASTTCRPRTMVAPVTANTNSDTPTGIGNWQETRQETKVPYSGDRYGAATAYYDGRIYVMNGGCSGLVTGADKTQTTTVLSQPQVAKYSISFDTDTDIFPSNWLVNGYNSYSGAKWNARYRSMTDPTSNKTQNGAGPGRDCSAAPMSDWGQETSQTDVVLGKINPAYTYTALDGSGANTSCARYFFFSLTADNTRALSFPENVSATTGPSITDLTLRFTADPSKRLMHGRTFIGGIQQPNDTPYYSY